MIEKAPDFWKELETGLFDAAVCTTNQIVTARGYLVMGGGIAREFRDNFPGIDREWGARISRDLMHNPGKEYNDLLICTRNEDCLYGEKRWAYPVEYLIGLPTKRNYEDDSPEELVIKSCKGLKYLANSMGWEHVLLTRPGCGLGGLDWKDIKKKISFLDDRFVVMHNEV